MPNYYVNKNAQSNGDHEVHQTTGCSHPADPANRLALGHHINCHTAVQKAKQTYPQSNGCKYCSTACHTS